MTSRNGGSTDAHLVDHPLLVDPIATRQLPARIRRTTSSQIRSRRVLFGGSSVFLISINDAPDSGPIWAYGSQRAAERPMMSLVYLVSGAGDPSENARSNVARSSEGMSETAM
jgi:hypothetical protein